MEMNLWQWAQSNGYEPQDLAAKLGYKSARYVEQILRGWSPVTDQFVGRFIKAFPQAGTRFFLPSVSEKSDIMSSGTND